MKYNLLPIHLLCFWYIESTHFFLRLWRNALSLLEEDLAVGLMFRLMFKPLFHDLTFVGRLLSFSFRLCRIFLGVIIMSLLSVLLVVAVICWWLLPVLAWVVSGDVGVIPKTFLAGGIFLFVYHLFSHPHKKVWQIKSLGEIFDCSLVKEAEVVYASLLQNSQVKNLLQYLELTPDNLSALTPLPSKDLVIQKAFELGRQIKSPYLQAEHFFVAFVVGVPNVDNQLLKMNTTAQDFVDVLDLLEKKAELGREIYLWDEQFHTRHLRGVNRGWLGVPTPELDKYADDLTAKASKTEVPDFLGRQQIVAQLINILSLDKGRNAVIVGEAGSGRTTLVDSLAKRIVNGDAPSALATKRLVNLDLTKLITGVKTQGEIAERIKNIFDDVESSANIIVCVDEIQNLGMGEVGSQYNIYSLMLPYLESASFQFIATTDPVSYTRILEKNASFARLFAKVILPPASAEETLDILKLLAIEKESQHHLKVSLPALKELTKLTGQYIHDRVLPDAALQLFVQTIPLAENGWVKKLTVDRLLQQITNVPVGEVEETQKHQLLNLEQLIHQRLIDQEEAVTAVANTLRRAAAHLREESRPIGSFLFVGPTGVGKTELAKILAETYFEGKGSFLRLDMSEFQTPDSVKWLIGTEDQEGILTEEVRRKPYTLILLDEFEKADHGVLTIFLQILDDGRLSGYSGRTVDFTSTIIIATSNAASLTIAQGIGAGQTISQLKEVVSNELLKIFKPELINRFDEVVLFKPLSPTDLQKVVQIKLAVLQNQLKNQGYQIEFEPGLLSKLAQKGYDPVLGARPLRRLIQDTLEAKLSVLILEGKLPKGQKYQIGEQLLI